MVRVFKSRYLRHMWFSPSQSISSTKDAFSLSLSFSLKYSLCSLSLKIVDLNNTCCFCLSLSNRYIFVFSKRYGSMSWFNIEPYLFVYIRLLQRSTYKTIDRLSLSQIDISDIMSFVSLRALSPSKNCGLGGYVRPLWIHLLSSMFKTPEDKADASSLSLSRSNTACVSYCPRLMI